MIKAAFDVVIGIALGLFTIWLIIMFILFVIELIKYAIKNNQ